MIIGRASKRRVRKMEEAIATATGFIANSARSEREDVSQMAHQWLDEVRKLGIPGINEAIDLMLLMNEKLEAKGPVDGWG